MKLQLQIETTSIKAIQQANSLLVQLDEQMLGYILYNNAEKIVFCWKVWKIDSNNDIKTIITKEFENLPASLSVCILNYTPRYMVMPSEINDKIHRSYYWEITHGFNENDNILQYFSKDNTQVFMHAVNKEQYAIINEIFPEAKWFPIQHISFRHLNINKGNETAFIEMCFFNQNIHMVFIDQSKILLSQVFRYDSPEDILWYLLKIIKTFGYSSDQVKIHPVGLIDTASSIFDLLNQYFNKLEIPKNYTYKMPDSEIEMSGPIQDHIDRILTCVL